MEFFQKSKDSTKKPLGVVKVSKQDDQKVSHKTNHKVSHKANHKLTQNKRKKKSINTTKKLETLYALRNAIKNA